MASSQEQKERHSCHIISNQSQQQSLFSKNNFQQTELSSSNFKQYSDILSGLTIKECITSRKQSLNNHNIHYNEICFQNNITIIYTDNSPNFSIIKLFVSFSHFSFDILILNLNQSSISDNYLNKLGEGSYGKIYQTKIDEELIAIKSINYSNNFDQPEGAKKGQKTISDAIFQFCLCKLFSAFQIGPKVHSLFHFDLIIFKDSIQFAMQLCEKVNKNSLNELFDSLNLMHSLKLIHGDIKPENIMWSPKFNKCVLIDFGLSKVLKQKPGQKTRTYFFGTFGYCSQEMKYLLTSSEIGFVDLYYNDLFGLKLVIQQSKMEAQIKTVEGKSIFEPPYNYANFIDNVWLSYLFYTKNERNLTQFCGSKNKKVVIEEFLFQTISDYSNFKVFQTMIKILQDTFLASSNVIQSYIKNKQVMKLSKIKKTFKYRIKQRMEQFNGPINTQMMVALIYFNVNITPEVYIEGKILFEELRTSQVPPYQQRYWRDIIKFTMNPYSNEEQIQILFETIKDKVGIKIWKTPHHSNDTLNQKTRQIIETCLQKYGFNLYTLFNEIFPIVNQRMLEYSKFTQLIKLHSNGFPYIQLIDKFIQETQINLSSVHKNSYLNIQDAEMLFDSFFQEIGFSERSNELPPAMVYLRQIFQIEFCTTSKQTEIFIQSALQNPFNSVPLTNIFPLEYNIKKQCTVGIPP